MDTEIQTIHGVSVEMLFRYVEMRRGIDAEAKTIHSLASLLALLQRSGDDRIEVDPVALGHINEQICTGILNIWEMLDDFIYIVQARSDLERVNKRGR